MYELRTNFAFYNAMAQTELDAGLTEKCKQYAQNFYKFGKQQSDTMMEVGVDSVYCSKWINRYTQSGVSLLRTSQQIVPFQ